MGASVTLALLGKASAPTEHSGGLSCGTKPLGVMPNGEFDESEFRIAVWFGRELHIGCRSKGTNAFNRANAANGNLAGWSDINPIGDAVERRGMGEELAGFCFVAETGGKVHWSTDVVITIE